MNAVESICRKLGGLWRPIAFFFFGFFYPFSSLAQGTGGLPPLGTGGVPPTSILQNPIAARSIEELVSTLLDVVVSIGGVIAVFFLIYAGYLFVVAQGNEERLKTAKRTFLWTVVGIAVLLGAKLISEVIKGTIEQLK